MSSGVAIHDRSWYASLELQLQRNPAGTRLSRCRHNGPLYVQKPFYPEGPELAHIYLLHPPGGIVSGDFLDIKIAAQPRTAALITTPGAARIYRAREEQPLQRQHIHIDIGTDASLEWFPLETIVYEGSCVELETTIELAAGSRFIGWEISCFGLPASGQLFNTGTYRQHYKLLQDGVPVFIDRLCIDDHNRQSLLGGVAGMQQHTVSGFFLLGPLSKRDSAEQQEQLLIELRVVAEQLGMSSVAAISYVGDFFIGRYLGDSADQARRLFTAWWQLLRPLLLERKACPPRIWLT